MRASMGAGFPPTREGRSLAGMMEEALRLPTAVPSPRRVRGVLSPCRERGDVGACAALWGRGIPAYAGMTVRGRE